MFKCTNVQTSFIVIYLIATSLGGVEVIEYQRRRG